MRTLSVTLESAFRMSDVDAAGVLHDSHRLRANRACEKLETELRVEIPGLGQIGDADADDLFHFSSRDCEFE